MVFLVCDSLLHSFYVMTHDYICRQILFNEELDMA